MHPFDFRVQPKHWCFILAWSWGSGLVWGQDCNTFGSYNVGPDVEVTCEDSCITLSAPPVANIAAGSSNYTVQAIPYALPYPFSQGAAIAGLTDDNYSGNIPIGFSFGFYGQNYTQVRVASNGYISFNLANPNSPFNPNGLVPAATLPSASIMAVYSDLNPATCGNVRYATYGNAPCRKFVVTWNGVCQFSCTSNQVNAEIVLHEGSNAIEVFIGNRPACGWGSATSGIQNTNGTQGVPAPGYNTGPWTANNVAFRYTSQVVVEGATLWYEGSDFLGMGPTLDFCTTQATTLTAWLGQLPAGTFCQSYPVSVSGGGTAAQNAQIGWSILSSNGVSVASGSAPFNGNVCLPNGCYTLQMSDTGNNGWGTAQWSLTTSTGVLGPFTLPAGSSGSANFCVTGYTGPAPGPDDYVQVASDAINITAVSDADASFVWPTTAICTGSEPFTLTPVEGGGSWEVDCEGCFDPELLTIDPGLAGNGPLLVTHVAPGTCIDDVFSASINIVLTPTATVLNAPGSLCTGTNVDLNSSPPFGTWSASCGACINAFNGFFFSGQASPGLNSITFTSAGLCPATTTLQIGVSDPLQGELQGPEVVCQGTAVPITADVPGFWEADCGLCINPFTGLFQGGTLAPGVYNITFTPDSFCPVESSTTITVEPGFEITSSNVPEWLCADAPDLQLVTNVPGGTWSADCGACLTTSGSFQVDEAGYGWIPVTYTVTDGACSDTATFEVEIAPVLNGSFVAVAPLCEGEQVDLQFVLDPGIPPPYSTSVGGTWSSPSCPGCVANPAQGIFVGNNPGTQNVVFNFAESCSQPLTGSFEVAPAVNAAISAVPTLCESDGTWLMTAANPGGVWSSDCGSCLQGSTFDPGVGAGTYEVTYTISGVCSDQDSQIIEVVPQRDAGIFLPDLVCLASEIWTAEPVMGGGIWSAVGPNCINCIDGDGNIDLMAAGLGMLEVTYTLPGLCGDTETVVMEIRACSVEPVNVFSPNGDGYNETLEFKYVQQFPGNRLQVFDRWGNLVYGTTNYQNGWRADGVADGTYYFVLEIPGLETIQGDLTIVR
jgi:gliding motility-associated-like protein